MSQNDTVEEPLVEEVILSGSGEAEPSSKLLAGDRREWSELRIAHEDAFLADKPIARCAACHQPVKPRMSKDKRRFFWHFRKNSQCPYQGKSGPSQRILDAMRYNGQKEGAEHRRIKDLLVHSIEADQSFNSDTITVERRWWGVTDESKWRKPDISAERQGVRIAFEVQLSSTYLSVMRERHMFYLQNGGLLFWIFSGRTTMQRQMQDDIFYWNNSNLFVADDETRRLSTEKRELILRCHYLQPQLKGPEHWQERMVRFSELTLDLVQQRAFYFDNAKARQEVEAGRINQLRAQLRQRFIALWTGPGAGSGEEFRHGYQQIASELCKADIDLSSEPTDDIKRLTWICLSAEAGTGVGLRHGTLLEVANYAYAHCPQLVHYLLAVAKRAGKLTLLLEQDKDALTKRKRTGKTRETWQDRIEGFRQSYRLHSDLPDCPYPVDRSYDRLFDFLFPSKLTSYSAGGAALNCDESITLRSANSCVPLAT